MAVLPALRESSRERTRERVDRLLELLHLLARRVHEVDVFGKRLAQRARHRLDAAVGDQTPPDLGLDHLLQDLQPAFVLFLREPLVEGALADRVVLLGLRHHLRDETFGIELPQRAVQVVRAAHRAGPAPCPRSARRPRPPARATARCPCASARRGASAPALRSRADPSHRRPPSRRGAARSRPGRRSHPPTPRRPGRHRG